MTMYWIWVLVQSWVICTCTGSDFRSSPDLEYGVLIDAGSTGSKVIVYTWPRPSGPHPTYSVPHLDRVYKHKLRPGIGSYGASVKGVNGRPSLEEHVLGLLNLAKQNVPQEQHDSTFIYVMATAGIHSRLVQNLPSSNSNSHYLLCMHYI